MRFRPVLILAVAIVFLNAHNPAPAMASPAPEWLGRKYDTTIAEEWMNVLFNGQKIGFSYNKIEKGPEGYRITGRALMRLSMMGMTQDLSFSQTFHLDEDKEVLGFVSLKKVQSQRMQTIGTVKGNVIELEIKGAGGTRRAEGKIKRGTMFLETLGFTLADSLKVGMRKTVPVYIIELRATDTLTVSVVDRNKMKIDGEEKDVFVVDINIQGFTTRSHITSDGVIIKEEESLMGITHERVTEEQALAFPASAVPVTSLITFSLVKPDKPIPAPESLKELNMVISGIEDPGLIMNDQRQMKKSPEWKQGDDGKRALYLPLVTFKSSPVKTVTISEAARAEPEYIKPSPEIQSDNKMIIKTAKEIVGEEKDAWAAAKRINRWVYKNIKKKLVDSFTAIDTFFSREGECQAHTNLFAALARAAGIPTREAAGLVYSSKNEGFLYHAWPEVFVGEWVAVDPTLGQEVADVTHIKLTEGGLESQIRLVRFLGRISLSIESYE